MPPASSSAISILPTNIVVPKSASSGSTLRGGPQGPPRGPPAGGGGGGAGAPGAGRGGGGGGGAPRRAPRAGGLGQRRLRRVARLDARRDRPRPPGVADLDEHEVRGQPDRALPPPP